MVIQLTGGTSPPPAVTKRTSGSASIAVVGTIQTGSRCSLIVCDRNQ